MSNDKRDTKALDTVEGFSGDTYNREAIFSQQTTISPAIVLTRYEAGVTGTLDAIRSETDTAKDGEDKQATRETAPNTSDETTPTRPQTAAAEAPLNAQGEKPHILIVEDTQELAEVIQATLENAGMNVEYASRGAKGLDKIKVQTPDVLLLDIGLPDMTGWKMLEELHEWKGKDSNTMPTVVIITAYGDPANRLIGKLQGIHSYLIKPFTSEEVEQVVRSALNATA